MESNKLEKQIKERLKGREIQPSEAAWSRVAEQLEGEKKSHKSRRFYGYGIAAGFVGILFLSVLYFTANDASVEPGNTISNSLADSIPMKNIPVIIPEKQIPNQEELAGTGVQKEKSIRTPSAKNVHRNDRPVENQLENYSNNLQTEAMASTVIQDRNSEKVALPLNASEELIHTKVAEVVARVEGLESKNESVTDAEIDSLLRNAQREIMADKIFRQDNSVDAMALLADVEQELDQSFRDQIFDALKDGFLKVRTAVADRNR